MKLTVVMYHYVRPIKDGEHPKIKGLEFEHFKTQVDRLSLQYSFVNSDMLVEAVSGGPPLPENACLLTFDDGYTDHYKFVFPYLLERGIQGVFFPPKSSTVDRVPLMANLIHYILASPADVAELINAMESMAVEAGIPESEIDNARQRLLLAGRFDDGETIYFKRMLQKELPYSIRKEISSRLFDQYDGRTQSQFVNDLYMTEDHLRYMMSQGMSVGSHGSSHNWLSSMTPEQQEEDLVQSLSFLKALGINQSNWLVSYPYGGFDKDTLEICERLGFSAGFTVASRVANLETDHRLLLPRIDTNEI